MSEPTTQVAPAVAAGPKSVSWAPVPKVNLLPVEILEGRSFRRTQMVLAGVIILVVGAIGAGTVIETRAVDDAQAEADAAQARVTKLQEKQTEYASVPQVIAQIAAAEAARTSIYSSDVRWYRYLTQIDRARPTGVELQGITVTLSVTDAASTGTSTTDVLTPSGIGSIQFTGTGDEYSQASAWMESIAKVGGLTGATLSSASMAGAADTGGMTFSTSVVMTEDALSGRYQTDGTDTAQDSTAQSSDGTTGTDQSGTGGSGSNPTSSASSTSSTN
ncbi:hypothetical protein [Kineosporia sp. NBRC 101731]|uniref:hypothetical protein n=1 Tax=Kineosporia sp. NBRC 101731 TaxID=3032199 RepID=UPI0024A502FA|nr:hypothetical protein [Kineosporia sp. NBRC 101731]GLY30589.1 hypothetical protein Kisp02_39540 [Kineosporia sp. NBRC 101731]